MLLVSGADAGDEDHWPATHVGTADAEWTAVIGRMEGTFTRPMVLPGGKTIQPTGKSYSLPMATIGHWNKQGIMFEEYLFWDNQEFMKEIGLGQ